MFNKLSTKFGSSANTSTSSIVPNDNSTPVQDPPPDTDRKESWLHHVKGKIAQKVEEKYTEYKNEKEMKKLINHSSGSSQIFNIDEDFLFEASDDEEKLISIPHSYSEDSLPVQDSEMNLGLRRSSTPVISDDVLAGQRSGPTSPKERRRFTFSFLDRSGNASNAKAANQENVPPEIDPGSIPKTSTPAPGSVTPTKSSLRSRVMEKFMGKSPGPTVDEPKVSMKNVSLNTSALDLLQDEENKEPSKEFDQTQDSDIETAVEADELLTFESQGDNDTMTNKTDQVLGEQLHVNDQESSKSFIQWAQGYWWSLGLPFCFLLFLQLLPLPTWITGFVTGILIAVPTAAYVTYSFMDDNSPRTPFVENVERKQATRPAIIVQEELNRIYVSHNLSYLVIP